MKAEATSLKFLSAAPQKLIVPFFQRRYVWDESNWEELFQTLCIFEGQDIINLVPTKRPFLGAIILKAQAGHNPTSATIIDGQQRLTTISVLTKALYDSLDADSKKDALSFIEGHLFYKIHVTDPFTEGFVKIEHSKNDKKAYNDVIELGFLSRKYNLPTPVTVESDDNKIIKCYKYFLERIKNITDEIPEEKEKNIAIKNILNFIYGEQNKMIVLITVDEEDDEQTIFDTINRAGVRLSIADVIKNDLFSKCMVEYVDKEPKKGKKEEKAKEVYDLHSRCWEEIFYKEQSETEWDQTRSFGNLSRTNLEFFLYCFSIIKWGYEKEVSFKNPAKKYSQETKDMDWAELKLFIEELAKYAKIYKKHIIDFKEYKEQETFCYTDFIQRLLLILDGFGIQMFYPYVIERIKEYEEIKKEKGDDELIEELVNEYIRNPLWMLESFIVRRKITGGSTSKYAELCDELIRKGEDHFLETVSSDEKLDDTEVIKGLNTKPSNTNATMVLFCIELYKRYKKEYDEDLKYNYSLEHIMPSKWEEHWRDVEIVDETGKKIDDKSEESNFRKQHIESLGNMTLLKQKLNSRLQNKSFQDKIKGDKKKIGYQESTSLLLTREIVHQYESRRLLQWNEAAIRERFNELFDCFKKIWPWK